MSDSRFGNTPGGSPFGDDAVMTTFLERLQQQIQALVPEDSVAAVLEQARSVLRQGFAEFELVPRHELDGHLAALEGLNQTIKALEQRIARLETET
ncbi:MAG: accessory factor UbiK family protein [Gammaproteobacteria bacterium]|nr:accessory factor UbiK family protein [Gammaproteobacteria bacterium]